MHNCPRCGKNTEGTWSEGGAHWDICGDCMEAERSHATTNHPIAGGLGVCSRCGGSGLVRNGGGIWVRCPTCGGRKESGENQ